MNRPPDLPDFEDPPVVEVVLAVRFQAIEAMTAAHLGVFWKEFIAQDFPTVEERSPVDPIVERFDGIEQGIRFDVFTEPPSPRVWLVNAAKDRLVQVQNNWFAHNWRKVGEKDRYPRYETIRSQFESSFSAFARFIKDQDLGDLEVGQCEIVYINHLFPNDVWSEHGDIHRMLRTLTPPEAPRRDRFLPPIEDARLATRYLIKDDKDRPYGRLHVEVQPGVDRSTETPMYRITLTARGAPEGPSLDDVLAFFDLGRRWIVKGFTELTSDAAHRAWRRTQ